MSGWKRGLSLATSISLVLFAPVGSAAETISTHQRAPHAVSVTTTTATQPDKPQVQHLVPPYIVAMWEKVATCETGGRWWRNAPYYDGGLGISRRNWDYFAPEDFPDAPHLASKEQQVFVARKIQAWGGVPNYVPDQAGGCHAW